MKKYFFFITLSTFLSCKENTDNYQYDDSDIAVDTSFQVEDNSTFIDSTTVPTFEDDNNTSRVLTYEEAIETNSIFDLKEFINNNPNHENIDLLNKRLIDLEVEEIYNDKNTYVPCYNKIIINNNNTNINNYNKGNHDAALIPKYLDKFLS